MPIYAPNQDDRLYHELDIMGGRFTRLGWRAIVATDFLIKMLHQTRPYERNPGKRTGCTQQQLSRIEAAIEKGGDAVFRGARATRSEAFLAIPRTGEQKPVVGIVGEIYIRSNRFGNNDLVRKVEEFGGEAWLAPITEWITYVNYTGKKKSLDQRGLSGAFPDHAHRLHTEEGRAPHGKDLRALPAAGAGAEDQVRAQPGDAVPR